LVIQLIIESVRTKDCWWIDGSQSTVEYTLDTNPVLLICSS